MNLVVDTSVWSLVLRRRRVQEDDGHVRAFRACVEGGHGIHLIGNILQELLDGVKTSKDFERLIQIMAPFPMLALRRETYVAASKLRNHCRGQGIQASSVDFLIAAACIESGYPLLTADHDFRHIARCSELTLLV